MDATGRKEFGDWKFAMDVLWPRVAWTVWLIRTVRIRRTATVVARSCQPVGEPGIRWFPVGIGEVPTIVIIRVNDCGPMEGNSISAVGDDDDWFSSFTREVVVQTQHAGNAGLDTGHVLRRLIEVFCSLRKYEKATFHAIAVVGHQWFRPQYFSGRFASILGDIPRYTKFILE